MIPNPVKTEGNVKKESVTDNTRYPLKFSPKTTGAGAAYGLFELGYITGADC
jgi:hypothetical protein